MNESPTSENIRTSPTSVNQGIKKVLGASIDEVINTMNESPTSQNICTFPTSANQAIKKVQKSKKKIHRPSPYCQTEKMESALIRHLKQVHNNEPDVVQALSLPRREQIKAFQRLWREEFTSTTKKNLKKNNQVLFVKENNILVPLKMIWLSVHRVMGSIQNDIDQDIKFSVVKTVARS